MFRLTQFSFVRLQYLVSSKFGLNKMASRSTFVSVLLAAAILICLAGFDPGVHVEAKPLFFPPPPWFPLGLPIGFPILLLAFPPFFG